MKRVERLALLVCLFLAFVFILGLVARPALAPELLLLPDGRTTETLPFALGETLTYDIKWNPPLWLLVLPGTYHAGVLTLKVDKKFDYQGRPAYRLTADAKSSGTLPRAAGVKIEDYFESILDAKDLCSQRITKRIREGKRKRDIEIIFYKSTRTVSFHEVDVSKNPPQEKKQELKEVPACVQDVLSVIYAARLKAMEPGDTYPISVSDDGKVKDVQIKVLKRERIKMQDGQEESVRALKLQVLALFGGLYKSTGNFFIWVSDDDKKIPLKFDAKAKLGRVFGFLKKPSQDASN
jgi:hypothetical protein